MIICTFPWRKEKGAPLLPLGQFDDASLCLLCSLFLQTDPVYSSASMSSRKRTASQAGRHNKDTPVVETSTALTNVLVEGGHTVEEGVQHAAPSVRMADTRHAAQVHLDGLKGRLKDVRGWLAHTRAKIVKLTTTVASVPSKAASLERTTSTVVLPERIGSLTQTADGAWQLQRGPSESVVVLEAAASHFESQVGRLEKEIAEAELGTQTTMSLPEEVDVSESSVETAVHAPVQQVEEVSIAPATKKSDNKKTKKTIEVAVEESAAEAAPVAQADTAPSTKAAKQAAGKKATPLAAVEVAAPASVPTKKAPSKGKKAA